MLQAGVAGRLGSDIVEAPPGSPERLPEAGRLLFFGIANATNHCLAATPKTSDSMTETRPTRADAATAGLSMVGAMTAGAAAGYGLGSLVGLAIPLGLIGLFAGLAGGFAVVYARFRRL